MADPLQIEQLLATMDPAKVIAGKATLGIGQMRAAAEMVKRMRKRIVAFMGTDDFQPDTSPLEREDYLQALSLVSMTPPALESLYAVVPDREVATDIDIEAKKIKDWANTSIPRDEDEGFAGSALSSPPALNVYDWLELWRIARNPMQAVADLEDGQLSDEGVLTLQTLWPAFYAAIRQAVSDAYAAIAARRGTKWQPEPRKALLLKTLLGAEAFDTELAAAVQQAGQPKPTQMQPQPQESTQKTTQEATPGQVAAAG